MNKPEDEDAFEQWLTEALDPGEVAFSEKERSDIRNDVEFVSFLASELDPGEIELGVSRREVLAACFRDRLREDELTAWALGEISEERRVLLEEQMRDRDEWRTEGQELRHFCNRTLALLPAMAVPGWWERRRLRRVFAGPLGRDRALWPAVAAVATLLVVRLEMAEHAVSGEIPTAAAAVSGIGPAGFTEARRLAEFRVAASPPPGTARAAVAEAVGLVAKRPAEPHEPAYAFGAAPQRPVPRQVSVARWDLERLLSAALGLPVGPGLVALGEWNGIDGSGRPARVDRDRFASLDFPRARVDRPEWASAGFSPMGSVGPGFLPSAAAIARVEQEGDTDGWPDVETGDAALSAPGPEPGSLVLAQSQPYLLSALLRGPVSGRPDPSRVAGGPWIAADFQVMDLGLASGQSGVEFDTWRAEGGIGWALSSEWSAALSLAGIDSRMEVPGFGRVDAEGATFAWSIDCRYDDFHAALTHTLGVFDQNLRRRAGGMVHPVRQDAAMQAWSLWLARDFAAGRWTHGPVASVDGSWGSLDGYREPFAGGVAMAERDFALVTTLVGWQLSAEFDTASGGWRPHAVVGWRHRPVLADAALVQAGPGGDFALPSVSPERDSVLIEAGLRWLPPGDRVFLDAVSSAEWRDRGRSEHSLLFRLGVDF